MGRDERDCEEIAAEAYEEMAAEKENREPKDLMPKPVEEGSEADGSEETSEPNIEVVDDNQQQESEEEQTDDDADKPKKESEEVSETEESEEEVDLDAKIEEHSKKYEMNYAEAKEDIEKTEKMIEQFKNDPKEMARALRSKDREYDKLKNELTKVEKKKEEFQPLSEDQFRYAAKQHIEAEPEKYLEAYKKRYPAKAEILSDEALLEEIVDREYMGYQSKMKEKVVEIKNTAIKIREDIVNNIKEADKRFIPEVKAILSNLTDQDLIVQDADFSYLLQLAKGKMFDEEIKKAEERAVKRGKEDPKILGTKQPTSKKPKAPKESSGISLNSDQKDRAEDMFQAIDGYSEEDSYRMFKETYASDLKKDPNFI